MFEETRKIVEERLINNWTKTPIDIDNVDFTPAFGQDFIRLQIEWSVSEIGSFGKRTKGIGFVLISVFTKGGEGTEGAFKSADELATLFNFYNESFLRFEAAIVQRIGQKKNKYQVNVSVPFVYDSCFVPIVGYGGLNGYGN